MPAKAIHHIALTVNDWDRSRVFYIALADMLGTKPFIDALGAPHPDPDGRVLIFAGEGFMYSIWEAKPEYRGNRYHYYNVGLHHLAFAASTRDVVDKLYQRLADDGAEIIDPPQEYDYVPGYYAVFFKDPDGMKLEYAYVPD